MVNDVTRHLLPYPMEELTRIRQDLVTRGQDVYDFGTGDPKMPTWEPIRAAIQKAIPFISQYPSVKGQPEVTQAVWGYMQRRFAISPSADLRVLPSNGSKEAIFSVALTLIGRHGKKLLVYPDPGYPVYHTSAIYAGGQPYPVCLRRDNGYLLEPWELPEDVQRNTAALWINHPHNPTGAMAPRDYFERVIKWAESHDVIVLSDDCYVDIYDASFDHRYAANPKDDQRPFNPLTLTHSNIISFMSLSKRSGMTGYRTGAMVGDADLLKDIERARANFGCATPNFILAGAKVAWDDDAHVADRRQKFTERIDAAFPRLKKLGLIDERPNATFYLWCRTPEKWSGDDVRFCLDLAAATGVVSQPSQWLSEGVRGFVRFALVPEVKDMLTGFDKIADFLR